MTGRAPAPPPSTPTAGLTDAVCALRAEPETGVAGAGVATGPRDAPSRAADPGIALTHARRGTWGVQTARVPPSLSPLHPSTIPSDPLPKTPSWMSLPKPSLPLLILLSFIMGRSHHILCLNSLYCHPKSPLLNIVLSNPLPEIGS